MNITLKMEEKKMQFDHLTKALNEQDEIIVKANGVKTQINEEMFRLQGEYRILVELGQELGVVDENGEPIKFELQEPMHVNAEEQPLQETNE